MNGIHGLTVAQAGGQRCHLSSLQPPLGIEGSFHLRLWNARDYSPPCSANLCVCVCCIDAVYYCVYPYTPIIKSHNDVQVLATESIQTIQRALDACHFVPAVELVKRPSIQQIDDSDIFAGFEPCKGMVGGQRKTIDVGGAASMLGPLDFYFRQETRIDIVINQQGVIGCSHHKVLFIAASTFEADFKEDNLVIGQPSFGGNSENTVSTMIAYDNTMQPPPSSQSQDAEPAVQLAWSLPRLDTLHNAWSTTDSHFSCCLVGVSLSRFPSAGAPSPQSWAFLGSAVLALSPQCFQLLFSLWGWDQLSPTKRAPSPVYSALRSATLGRQQNSRADQKSRIGDPCGSFAGNLPVCGHQKFICNCGIHSLSALSLGATILSH
ncbi:hypothetical protein AAY473_034355 [Plecturocebus cupreus]